MHFPGLLIDSDSGTACSCQQRSPGVLRVVLGCQLAPHLHARGGHAVPAVPEHRVRDSDFDSATARVMHKDDDPITCTAVLHRIYNNITNTGLGRRWCFVDWTLLD